MPIFLVSLQYTKPITEIEAATPDHRAYLRTLLESRQLLASGPYLPRTGGLLVMKARNRDEVEELIAQDPFKLRKLAIYEIREWTPVMGAERLA